MRRSRSRSRLRRFGNIGIKKVIVPDLSGRTRSQAQADLSAAGLSWTETPSTTSNSNINLNIVSQGTAAGTTVLIGSQVPFTYYVYEAPPNFNPGFSPDFSNPGFNPGFAPVNDCVEDSDGYCDNGTWMQYWYSPSGQFNCPAQPGGPCGVTPDFSTPDFSTPDFSTPDFSTPDFSTPDFSNPGFADPGFDITLTSLDLSSLFTPGKSVGIETLVRTTDGLAKAGDLQVGDTLLSANIEGFPYESSEGVTAEAIAWSDNNPSIIPEITTIVNLYKTQSAFAVVINEDIFSQYHYILIKRDGTSKFETSVNVVKETDLVYSYDTGSWEPIYLYEIVEAVHDIVSINCEPYDMFFTERMLTHDSSAI